MFTCAGFLCHKRKFLAPIGADTKYSEEREQTLKKAKDFALQTKNISLNFILSLSTWQIIIESVTKACNLISNS
ncbi:hypothetical protein DRW42_17885 [Pedobacter miscanthi]|uniref:Uncharacterized protein n=1 Tax=Pedobacter miscanthi TaxID=2259170 RepID=A0A366KS85_9SPHI|nr:hypothetical protein DRW42_17885 [Pedobacter miscanthi]